MNSTKALLDRLRLEVNLNLAYGAVSDLPLVTNDDGDSPVVVALDSEPLSTMLGRIRAVGGCGIVFSRGASGSVRMLSVIQGECALHSPADSVTPGAGATVGMFLDYVELHPDGVAIPAAFDHPAMARDAREVELTSA